MATESVTKKWSQTTLGDICSFIYGKGLSEKDRLAGDIPVYGSNGIVGFHNCALVSAPGIVIGRKGSAGLVHFSETPFYPIDTTFYITQNDAKVDLKFLFYLFTHGTKGEKTKIAEIGEVPESWRITTVGDFCDVKGGKRLPKGQKLTAVNTGLPYIRVTDLSENGVDISNIQYLKPETQKTISRYTISTTDIYISIAGSIGFVGIIPYQLEGANLTENAAKLVLKTNKIQQKFLMYWLAGDQVQRDVKSQTVKNAQPKLALARIQKLLCVLPIIEEQKQISDTIDAIVLHIENAQSKLTVYQNLFKILLHELISGSRRLGLTSD